MIYSEVGTDQYFYILVKITRFIVGSGAVLYVICEAVIKFWL